MENTLKNPAYPMVQTIMERGRLKILSAGYDLILFKSKLRKRIFLYRRMIYRYTS